MKQADEFMLAAIAAARKSRAEGGIPIGSALRLEGKLISVGHNKRVQARRSGDTRGNRLPAQCRQARQLPQHGSLFDFDALLPLRRRCGPVRHHANHRGRKQDVRRSFRLHALAWRRSRRFGFGRVRGNDAELYRRKSNALE